MATVTTATVSETVGTAHEMALGLPVLFPEDGITKGDLFAHYDAVAPMLLPHLAATGRSR
jgi:bifunctional non-homologous end joining protein LigD